MNQDGDAWKTAPDNKLFVIDLNVEPPKLVDTVAVGAQPSGMAISHNGRPRADRQPRWQKRICRFDSEWWVKSLGEVPLEQEAAAVVIAPDGKRAFVCMNLANRIGVLNIEGQKVTYDKSLDIPAAFNPYNIDITPDGKYVIASNTGAMKNNADAEVVIEATGPHPHVVDLMTPGIGPEGFAISPDGKWAAAPLLRVPPRSRVTGSGPPRANWHSCRSGPTANWRSRAGRSSVPCRRESRSARGAITFMLQL